MFEKIKDKILNNKIEYFIITLLIVAVPIFILCKNTKPVEKKDVFIEDKTVVTHKKKNIAKEIFVDIQGEVVKPGFYHLQSNSRVFDLIQLAGGITELADRKNINQAKKIQDQEQVYIPKVGETPVVMESAASNNNSLKDNSSGEKININAASIDDFQKLNGVGPKKAEQIFQYREQNGDFSKVEDLTKVTGIGAKTLESFKEQITV